MSPHVVEGGVRAVPAARPVAGSAPGPGELDLGSGRPGAEPISNPVEGARRPVRGGTRPSATNQRGESS